MKKLTAPINDADLKLNGIEVLNKNLGATDALRFLSLLHREPTDYVQISRRLYQGQSVSDIFQRVEQSGKK